MKPDRRFRVLVPALLLSTLAGTSCTEEQDTRNIVQVYSLNENLPLLSDVYNNGKNITSTSDDFIPTDIVEVTFISRVHDDVLETEPGGPFGSVTITSYDVVYGAIGGSGADLDGNGSIDLPNFTSPMNAVVPVGGSATSAVLIVSGAQKSIPPIVCLGPAGGGCSAGTNEFSVSVTITFHGVEETSGAEITVNSGILVRIGQYADQTL